MAYKLELPREQLAHLWRLREYAASGPIAKQVRQAISDYLKAREKEIGCSIEEVAEVRERHARGERKLSNGL